ncbi:predicted protein [Histoplasma mississippiense (nom. inval.)]|uniref:predicted protein n=1 Tax=Ajellomyces capsulatus (strain NAm1 / WU24) TaxID=2059318 RepID=UPI000157BFB4|nr:predicted protein [Histoplasma mississippiense (nom. inval.)]EDN07029.1 predicted protein [Histoplasma mississippiense (nom. inval.)]
MASSNPLRPEDLVTSIETEGFFSIADSAIGRRVDEFAAKQYPFRTLEGLDFCKTNTLDEKHVRQTVESFFSWSALALHMTFRYFPQHAYCMADPREPKLQVIVVQLLGTGSKIILYKRSHHTPLKPKEASNGLLEVQRELLKTPDIEEIQKDMKDGGLVVLDARLSFNIQGRAITLAFANKEELARWGRIKLPNNANLRQKVKAMETEKIGMNYEFED